MKKIYILASAVIFLTALSPDIHAQAIQLDDNHNLSGYPFNGKLQLRSDRDSTFWESDGTTSGTRQFSTVKSDETGFAVFNGKVYFSGMDASHGTELWSTDGTGPNTVLVADVLSGPDSSKPADFIIFNNNLYFTSFTNSNGRELYEYTGSGAPVRITDFNPGSGSSFDEPYFASVSNTLYFDASSATGKAIYGMQGNTITKILDLPAGFDLRGYARLGNTIFCSLISSSAGMKIYKTTGVSPASLVKDFSNPMAGFFAPQMISWKGKIFFTAAETGFDTELWTTDGTTTAMLKDINPGTNGSMPIIMNAVELQNKLVFAATTDDSGMELWITDGTETGTQMLIDLNLNPGDGSNPVLFLAWNADINNPIIESTDPGDLDRTLNYNGYIFFAADNGTDGEELYKTDGTPGNTVMVKNINSAGDGIPASLSYIYTKSGLVFAGDDGTNGAEPWISNGTSGGTLPIVNINLSGDSDPGFYYIWKGDIYLSADDGSDGGMGYRDLYKLQGPYISLPVTLSQWKATVTPQNIILSWTTQAENNTDHFEVLRSTDGTHFTAIGKVAAAGNSDMNQRYSLNDDEAYHQGATKLFYRLKTVDKDGAASYSKIISVVLKDLSHTLSLFPNPAHEVLRLTYNTTSAATISISGLSGKIIYRATVSPAQAGNIDINVSTFMPGTYFLKLVENNRTIVRKFIKE